MAHPKKVGLFTHTLSPSPTVRWILPARIRTKSQNDLVFVSENFVQLREALPDGRLADVTAKAEMGASILAAKVISAKLDLVPTVEQILNQAREDERERYVINDEEIDEETPPQIVVLSLATNELAFLFAKDSALGKTRFIYSKKRFLRDVSLAERFCSHIAVDPESRAIAVAPAIGYLGIFSLKQINEIQAETREAIANPSHIFKPTNQDRYLQIDGVILKMEFLPSTSTDTNKLILLLLVAHQGNTSLLLYRWDNREGPKYARPMMCSGQRLPKDDSLPLMLIPSSRCPSFVIVTETHLAVYDNIITDQAKRVSFPCRREAPDNYESSSVSPLWVQWAKPKRHAKYLEKHDDIYLVREDGELRYYVINHESPMKVDAHYSPGSLNVSVDQAFAIVAAPAELGADVFVAGGDLSDGGVWHCVARQTPVCVQTLPNLAPVRDMLITNPQDRFSIGPRLGSQNSRRVFTSSGKESKFSFVNEIRFGLEADIGCTIEHGDASSVTNLWILRDRRPERVLFLMSHPLHTSIVSLDPTSLDVEFGDPNNYPGLDHESPTLAAACTADGLTIQLTRDSTNTCMLSRGPRRASMPHIATTCIAAAVEASSGYFVVANRSPRGFHLRTGAANMKMEILFSNHQYDLPEEPTALNISLMGNVLLVLVGLSDGTLLVFCADGLDNLVLLSSYYMQHVVGEDPSCTVSSVEVLHRSGAGQGLVLCGLRTGILVILSMTLAQQAGAVRLNINFIDKLVLGSTRVGIVGEQGKVSVDRGALVSCESDLRRISLLDDTGLQYKVSQLWLTNQANTSTAQPLLNAVCRVLDHPAAAINGLLVCISDSDILISSLMLHDAIVPRRHKLNGPPERLAYSKYLGKLIVAINLVETTPILRNGTKPTIHRLFRPHLQLIDPDEEYIANQTFDGNTLLTIGENGDRIRALIEWRPADEKAHFELIVVGIDSDAPDYKLPSGRLLFLNVATVKKLPFSNIKVTTAKRYSDRPIYSLHPHGISSLLVGAGNDVLLETLDMKTRKLSTLATFALPSAAISLYSSGLLIYAATLHHSLLVLRKHGNTIENLASDHMVRSVRSALILDGEFDLLNVLTGRGTSLVGLAKTVTDKQDRVLFDAHLPVLIETVQQSSHGPDDRCSLDAISMDGTLYGLKVLQEDEWRLLRFLERLFHDDLLGDLVQLDPFLYWETPKVSAQDMHIDGDTLTVLVELGPSALRNMLVTAVDSHTDYSSIVKIEQSTQATEFENLATTVLGDSEDVIADVVKWLRNLMRTTK